MNKVVNDVSLSVKDIILDVVKRLSVKDIVNSVSVKDWLERVKDRSLRDLKGVRWNVGGASVTNSLSTYTQTFKERIKLIEPLALKVVEGLRGLVFVISLSAVLMCQSADTLSCVVAVAWVSSGSLHGVHGIGSRSSLPARSLGDPQYGKLRTKPIIHPTVFPTIFSRMKRSCTNAQHLLTPFNNTQPKKNFKINFTQTKNAMEA